MINLGNMHRCQDEILRHKHALKGCLSPCSDRIRYVVCARTESTRSTYQISRSWFSPHPVEVNQPPVANSTLQSPESTWISLPPLLMGGPGYVYIYWYFPEAAAVTNFRSATARYIQSSRSIYTNSTNLSL